jgi:phosphotriesterase-related protein
MASVCSVTGPVAPASLDQVLAHEHLIIDYGQMAGAGRGIDSTLRDRCVHILRELRRAGVGTVVDCTPPGYGRDLRLLAELSRESGVHIVASTGSFCEQWCAQPRDVAKADVDRLAQRFVDDLRAPAPSAGVIKVATSHDAMTVNERKLLRAAASAHRVTDAPIVSHTTDGLGLEQLDLFAREGVEPAAVLISHVCAGTESVEYAVEIARCGAYVGFDRIGHAAHDTTHWTRIISRLLEEGLADRVVLSHDSVQRFDGPAEIASNTFSDPLYINREFLPILARYGVSPGVQWQMTHRNPRRWLAREEYPDEVE